MSFYRTAAGSLIAACTAVSAIPSSQADSPSAEAAMEQVKVEGHPFPLPEVSGSAEKLLRDQGVEFFSAGGVSALPSLNGLNDERIKLTIDGASTTSACANHMNPVLSYIDASRISSVKVMAGLTPVSAGGDSIAGSIQIESEQPVFSNDGQLHTGGSISYFYGSNRRSHGVVAQASVAGEQWSLAYSGSNDKAESYRDGHGDRVLDTLYRSENHALTLGWRGEQKQLTIKLTHQDMPYQGFPNQYMDMVGNRSDGINLRYVQEMGWGTWQGGVYWQDVSHEMGFFSDDKTGTMPMITDGRDVGYRLQASIPLAAQQTLTLGHEYHRFTLDDRWPAVPGHMMMGPNDFVNINQGERTRAAVFAEHDWKLNGAWQLVSGVRYEQVETDADDVQPYNAMPTLMMGMMPNLDVAASQVFNAADRHRQDDNLDVSVVAAYQSASHWAVEFGFARKTRSPSLYERYSWGRNTMAMTMIGWYGDANGYVGDIALEPEVAHTLSATLRLQSDAEESWSMALTPYWTKVDDYIDANQIGSFHPRNAMDVTRPLLQFANVDATLWGMDWQGQMRLINHDRWGAFSLDGRLAYTRGERNDHADLYQIMPLNLRVGLSHSLGGWENSLQVEWVDRKAHVDERRLENTTDAYTLLHWNTRVAWQQWTFSLQANNLLDTAYDEPLGGAYLSGWLAGDRTQQFASLPGQGRSLQLGVQYSF